MIGYTKLFGSILDSSLWVNETNETRLVWITMLAMSDKHGEVSASVPGLAARAKVSIPAVESALSTFIAPDPYSRTKDFEGRRIEAIDGGWVLLNHAKYRAEMSEDDIRHKAAERQKRYRERLKRDVTVTLRDVTDENSNVTPVTSNASNDMQMQNADTKAEAVKATVVVLPEQAEFWNSKEKLPAIKSWTPTRAKALRARLTDDFWKSNWREAIDQILQSDFCMGKNEQAWKADIDWLLQPNVVAKIMEGKYINRVVAAPKPTLATWKQLESVSEQINKHPANRESLNWSKSREVTPEMYAELKELRRKEAELKRA